MAESLHQRLPKEIVAFKLRIAPDLRWFAEELSNPDLQCPMQVRDPSLVPFDQLHIIHVRVADERIPLKDHDFLRVGDGGRQLAVGKAESRMRAISGGYPFAVRYASPRVSLV
jgi:hypothetical protein